VTETLVVICIPTKRDGEVTVHVKGATTEWCSICATEVWVAPSTHALEGDKQIICTDCTPGVLDTTKDPKLMRPTRAQREELRQMWSRDEPQT